MKIEVWTDIMCPYCYIGKINYDRAMSQFEHAGEVELEIKAFQLNPNLPGQGNGLPVMQYLVEMAGYSRENVNRMFASLREMAERVNVKFNLPNSVAANTNDAHRLVKLAATEKLESRVLSLISKAYFEEALDYSDTELLVRIGREGGLDEQAVRHMLAGDTFKNEVEQDIQEAHRLGIDTVPTFLFDRQMALVGSESPEVFLETLRKAYGVWKKSDRSLEPVKVTKGKACNADGLCEI